MRPLKSERDKEAHQMVFRLLILTIPIAREVELFTLPRATRQMEMFLGEPANVGAKWTLRLRLLTQAE